jgi:hypothetical protein
MPQFAKSHPTVLIEQFAVPVDENGLVDWLIDADPGDRIIYYRGHLAHDRVPSGKVLNARARADLNAVARRVMMLAGEGLVMPVQKRIGREDFLYIAVKARLGRVAGERKLATLLSLAPAADIRKSPMPVALAA